MPVDHSHRLHECVRDYRSAKLEALGFEISGKGFAFSRLNRVLLVVSDRFDDWAAIYEIPQVVGTRSCTRLHDLEVTTGIPDGGANF